MAQKIVIFEVAKALKEAGYPQEQASLVYVQEVLLYSSCTQFDDKDIAAPSYLSAWLWLWREKGIMVDTSQIGGKVDAEVYTSDEEVLYVGNELHDDPEEAIAKAIEYLVNNNLLV